MPINTELISSELTEQWAAEGYVIVRGLFSSERAARLRTVCEPILKQWRVNNPETGKPGGDRNATAMRHLNHTGYFCDGTDGFAELMGAIADPGVLAVCRSILGEAPLFRCTSLFCNPLDKSQDGSWHRDSQFHHADPEEEKAVIDTLNEEGNSVQLQVALVPSDDVEVVPGSHLRWDGPAEFEIRRADKGAHSKSNEMPGALRVALAAGDAVAFNPYGLHRGRYHTDKLRRTLMLTYTKTSKPRFDYFSDQPWFDEDGYLDELGPDARNFFEAFVTEYRDQWRQVKE
jgi:hypothetical protein